MLRQKHIQPIIQFFQHIENSVSPITHFILMTICFFPAAMVTRKFHSVVDMVNALRPLKTQGKLFNNAPESHGLSNNDITSFLTYLSTSKAGVDIIGIRIDGGLLTAGYFLLISTVFLIFKAKFSYIIRNL